MAQVLRDMVARIEPPVAENSAECRLDLVSAAAAAVVQQEAFSAVHALAKELDETTVYLMLVQLAVDIGWTPALVGPDAARDWVERQRFYQLVADFDV